MQMNQSQSADTMPYLQEYSEEKAIKRYLSGTAGTGINYLLHNVYGPIYERCIDRLINEQGKTGWRILEYGCGGGMNLIHLVKSLRRRGIEVESAIGTDFAEAMIRAAKKEAEQTLAASERKNVNFFVAPNENLTNDLATNLATGRTSVSNSFKFVFGVNTFRYCHRIGASDRCARDIFELLKPGGISVMIDMNNKFPFFRSRKEDLKTKPAEQCVLPSVDDYRSPFERAGFKILECKNFCWIPHSAKGVEFAVTKLLNPVLDTVIPSYAMRTLVISQKPK